VDHRSLNASGRLAVRTVSAVLALVGALLVSTTLASPLPPSVQVSVYADGLDHPRGMTFDDRGVLYVAEAGRGGRTRVALGKDDVFRVGSTARVSRIPRAGLRETFAEGFPSLYSERHEDYLGVAGVAAIGSDIYVLTATGWSGATGYDNQLIRIGPDGARATVMNYSQFSIENPSLARRSDPRADVPGGVPYGLVTAHGKLYTSDGNLEFVQEIGPDGQPLRRLLEYPTSSHVLTGMAVGPDGALYVAEMGFWPYPSGAGQVTRIDLEGQVSRELGGVTASLAVGFGDNGRLYVLEHSAALRQGHNQGRLVRAAPDGGVEVVLDGLDLPTGLIGGPDGSLYIADHGNRSKAGEGRILRVAVDDGSGLATAIRRFRSIGTGGILGLAALGLAGLGVVMGQWLR
jgi:hypothetical protein